MDKADQTMGGLQSKKESGKHILGPQDINQGEWPA